MENNRELKNNSTKDSATPKKKRSRRGGRKWKNSLIVNNSQVPLLMSADFNNQQLNLNKSILKVKTENPFHIHANQMQSFRTIPMHLVPNFYGVPVIQPQPYVICNCSASNISRESVPSTSKENRVNLVNNRKSEENKNEKRSKYTPFSNDFTLGNFRFTGPSKSTIWKPPVLETRKHDELPNQSILTEINFNFDIRFVKKSIGFFVKKRSSCKFINLNSFGQYTIFISNFRLKTPDDLIQILIEKTEKLKVDPDMLVICEKSSSLATASADETEQKPKRVRRKKKNSIPTPNTSLNDSSKKRTRYRERKEKKREIENFSIYLDENEVKKGLEDGTLIKGLIRINQRNHRDAYVTNINKGDSDYYIKSVIDQNRALDGDEVILKVKPESEWEDGRKTATVVHISKMVHSRTTVGSLMPLPKNENFAAFFPRDKRIPIIHIPSISWPNGFRNEPKKFAKNIFVAKITEWSSPESAKGLIIENIGNSNNLKNENLAILKTYGLDHEPFTNDLLKCLPKLDSLHDEWLEGRRDLRNECVFTIDPLTARDLDDAVSCKVLPDGNLEIGVHIADVSFYLKEGNELDKHVAWRATTTYMVDQAHHMLPVELCMSCSLLPGKDKLSFSVFWIMTPDGEILSTSFARTVMNSCVQLAYEHAQAIIDDPDNFDTSNFPEIFNGYTIENIKDIISKLYQISQNLRKKRFENGALRIDQIKLSFDLDPSTGIPLSYHQHEQKEANRLIEEFMLLANISVAEKIVETYPDIAFLRLHEPPKETMMVELKSKLESAGIHVDISSASSLQKSLWKYSSSDKPGQIRAIVLNHLLAKPMIRARYFCPGLKIDDSYSHFALNIPLYTHFTSPIRRYADIMVHRLLAASLDLEKKPEWDPTFVAEVAERCNSLKYNAKRAQEESTKLYYTLFIEKNGPIFRDAAVVDVKERTFDVLVLDSGEIVRVYLNEINNVKYTLEEIPCVDLDENTKENCRVQKKNWRCKLIFEPNKNQASVELMIELFTLVRIQLKKCNKKKKLIANLVRPL